MDRFIIAPEIATLLPTMRVVIVTASNLTNTGPNPEVTAFAEKAATETLSTLAAYPNAQSHPRIALYRDTLKRQCNIAPKKFPQSNESLYRRLFKARAPLRPINPLVDFYNALSVKHGVTAGAFDLGALRARGAQPLELRLSRAGDVFTALDAGDGEGDEVEVEPGEVVYAQGGTVLTRALAWRQARAGLVAEGTTVVVFMSEVLEEDGGTGELAATVAADLLDGLRTFWGVEGRASVLGAAEGTLSVDLRGAPLE